MNHSNARCHNESGTVKNDVGFEAFDTMNALKTGNAQADMAIAMFLPFLLRLLASAIGPVDSIQHWAIWRRLMFWKKSEKLDRRIIIYRTSRYSWGEKFDMDENSKNSVLQKAIKMYIHQVLKLKMVSAFSVLTQLEDSNAMNDDGDSYYYSDEEESKDCSLDDDDDDRGIVKLRVLTGKDLGLEGSTFKYDESSFVLTSPVEGAVDTFVQTAYAWYLEELRKQESNARYLYELQNTKRKKEESGGDSKQPGTKFKRYKLSDEKSFDSLFFQEKPRLLNLLDHFANRTGKYAVRGFPHKLGLLLHGPPGTGKTSLIKALAQHTGRSIVNVPLSKISTNRELMSVFFDRSYGIQGSSVSIRMDFKDVIFVMEDVDAATKIVKRRDGQKTATADNVSLPTPKSMWRMFLESASDDCKKLVKLLVSKSERLKNDEELNRMTVLRSVNQRVAGLPALGLVDESGAKEVCSNALEIATKSQSRFKRLNEILASHAKSIKDKIESGFKIDDRFVEELLDEVNSQFSSRVCSTSNQDAGANKAPSALKSETKSSLVSYRKPNPDALSLSGLLNVLDGVVDTPGRIVIMTTNHPEMLDPALIRPGRIDKKLLLGHMNAADIVAMMEHYFQEPLTKCQTENIFAAINGNTTTDQVTSPPALKLTPAQVEQLAAEYDELDDMISALCAMSPR